MSRIFKTILNPVDFSAPSGAAHALALELAAANGARLALIHVVQPFVEPMSIPYDPPSAFTGLQNRLQEDAQAQLDELVGAHPQLAIDSRVRRGAPFQEIITAASEFSADLVVLGTHGRTGVARFLLGSTAERVVRSAPCSVLTVHAGDAPAGGAG